MRTVRMALVAVTVLAGATACNNSDSENKSSSVGSVPVASIGSSDATGTSDAAGSAGAVGSPAVGGSAGTAGSGAGNPCGLVTAAEIRSATGISYPKGAAAIGEVNYCKYLQGSNYLLVEAYPAGGASVYQQAIDGAASVASGTVTKVAGIGDEAGYVARAGTLCVHSGTKNVCVVGPSQKADVALAKRALARM